MNSSKTISLLLLFAMSVIFAPSTLHAQDSNTVSQNEATANQQELTENSEELNELNIEIVADTNIRKASVINQGVNSYWISFDIVNEWDKTQPGIKYALELYRITEEGEYLMDKVVFDEVFSLTPGQSVHKDLSYSIPESLPGNANYAMQIELSSEKGMTLAIANAGELKKDGQTGIFIDPSQCHLQIDDAEYDLVQGVDLGQEEKLELVCNNVVNQSNVDIESSAFFITKKRTSYGEIVNENVLAQKEVFRAGEKKNISYVIDKAKAAQAYEGKFSMQSNGKDISNGVIFRYVIQGETATIQTATTDKDYYAKGDIAKVSILTSGNASSFPGARDTKAIENMMNADDLVLKVSIVDGDNKACSEETTTSFSGFGKNVHMEIPITANCKNLTALAKIENKNEVVLDQAEFEVKTVSSAPVTKQDTNNADKKTTTLQIIIMLIAIMLLIALIIYLIFKYANKNKDVIQMLFGLMALGSGLLLQVSFADAAAFTTGNYPCFVLNGVTGYCTVNGTYDAEAGTSCSNSTANASMKWSACNNITVKANLYINGQNVWSRNEGGGYGTAKYETRSSGLKTKNLGNLSAGSHNIPFKITFYHDWHDWHFMEKTETINASKNINVQSCSVAPSCSITFTPTPPNKLIIGSMGSLNFTPHNDADNIGQCTCTGLDSVGAFNLPAGTYNQSFAAAGTKNCTCTVASSSGNTATCSGSIISAAGAACNLPWGGQIISGASVNAYSEAAVPCGSSCASQTRTCSDGTLSGSYTNLSCSVGACCTPTNCEKYTCLGDTCIDCGVVKDGTRDCLNMKWQEVAN